MPTPSLLSMHGISQTHQILVQSWDSHPRAHDEVGGRQNLDFISNKGEDTLWHGQLAKFAAHRNFLKLW